jgi:hypothetical protein
MNPKEEVSRLVVRYWRNSILGMSLPDSVRCALISVSEIIKEHKQFIHQGEHRIVYWQEVEHELINMK